MVMIRLTPARYYMESDNAALMIYPEYAMITAARSMAAFSKRNGVDSLQASS